MPETLKFIDSFIYKGILLLLIFTPLAFGTVQPWSEALMEITAFSLFILFIIKSLLPPALRIPDPALRPPPSVFRFFPSSVLRPPSSVFRLLSPVFCLLILLQLLPLPPQLLTALSPSTLDFYRHFGITPETAFHPLSIYPDATRKELFRLLAYAAVFIMTVAQCRTKEQVHTLVKTILTMATALSILAIVQKLTWNGRLLWIYPVDTGTAPWGPYVNSDHFAGYLEMAIPLAMALFLYRAPRLSTASGGSRAKIAASFLSSASLSSVIPLFLLVLALSAVLFATFSRGGILAFTASSLFFAAITYRRHTLREKTGFLGLLAAVIFAAVVLASWDRLEQKFRNLEKDHIGRLAVWADSIGIVHDFPLFGTGLGTFKDAYMRYQTTMSRTLFDHAHNDYLELLTDTGLAGFSLAAAAFIFFFTRTFARWRRKHSMYGKCIGAGGLASVTAIAVHSFVDFNLHIPANALLLSVILALTYAAVFTVSDKNGVTQNVADG